jgi:cysteinyl-tRNA synthetase
MAKEIKLYNTLSKEKEVFKPINLREVKIYSCGPTVYHYAHIGNLRAYIFADILNNTLHEAGYNLKHQINITDVGHLISDADEGEDKMEKGSEREGKSVWEVAEFYTEAFFSDLKDLNINKEKFIWTRATDYIKEQIDMIKILEEKGYTYNTSDGIYFDTSKFINYAELARIDIEGLQKGKRIDDEKSEKKNKTDFALWKFSKEKRQMEWESPWGVGFPGWHIECSAMSRAVLGNHLDIHTGGIDHIPTHHTNEIAQSECSLQDETRFVNIWCHVNFLNADKGKMSKSSGEFLRLQSIKEKEISPLAYKYLLLMTHYRKEIKFSWESLDAANTAYQKLLKNIEKIKNSVDQNISDTEKKEPSENIKSYYKKFVEAMNDDLNTSIALATLWSLINDKNISDSEKYLTLKEVDKYFRLSLV